MWRWYPTIPAGPNYLHVERRLDPRITSNSPAWHIRLGAWIELEAQKQFACQWLRVFDDEDDEDKDKDEGEGDVDTDALADVVVVVVVVVAVDDDNDNDDDRGKYLPTLEWLNPDKSNKSNKLDMIPTIGLKTTDHTSKQWQYSLGPGVSLNQILIHE